MNRLPTANGPTVDPIGEDKASTVHDMHGDLFRCISGMELRLARSHPTADLT
jgi:hypothetical protein